MIINLEDVKTVNIVDVHDTIVAFATPKYGPEIISVGDTISPDDPEFRKSAQAVDAFIERHGIKTPRQELKAEESAVITGLDHLIYSNGLVEVSDENAHYVIPIKGAYERLTEMLEDDSQVMAVVSSSTVDESKAILSYLLNGGLVVREYVNQGRLRFVNAVCPIHPDLETMSKKDSITWEVSYRAAKLESIAGNIEVVNIFENSDPKRAAALIAAQQMFKAADIRDYARIDMKG